MTRVPRPRSTRPAPRSRVALLPRTGDRTEELFEAARRVYVWGRPIVALHRVLHEQALDPWSAHFRALLGRLAAGAELPWPVGDAFADVPAFLDEVSPRNVVSGWLDLREQPVRLTAASGRGAVDVWVVDLHARLAGIAALPPGDGRSALLVVGPGGDGTDAGSDPVVRCATDLCLVVGRRSGAASPAAGRPAGAELLAVRGRSGPSGSAGTLPAGFRSLPPLAPVDVRAAPSLEFLRVLDWMLALMPPQLGERRPWSELRTLGMGRDLAALLDRYRSGEEVLAGLRTGMHDVLTGRGAAAEWAAAHGLKARETAPVAPVPRAESVASPPRNAPVAPAPGAAPDATVLGTA